MQVWNKIKRKKINKKYTHFMERFGDFQKLKVKSVEFLKKTPHT